MARIKDLHLCKNIDDLEKRSEIPDVRGRKMTALLETASKLFIEAEKQYLEGDEEMAYVFYTKYFSLLNSIHKKNDYTQCKQLIRQKLGDNRTNKKTMDRLESLTLSLNERYQNLNAKSLMRIEKATGHALNSYRSSDGDRSRSRSISPKTNDIDLESMWLMTCQQLYDAMKSQNVLVMDCRSSEDYKTSHLYYALAFNVPQELISHGMSAGKLQDKLEHESKKLWSARAIKNHVVLMDWSCSRPDPPETSAIAILLNILKNFDPDVTYRSPIKILDGGYEFFKLIYPTMCTNPMVQAPISPKNDYNLIDDIEYPSVFDIQMKDELMKSTRTGTSPIRPQIDRASKQAALKTYDDKEKAINDIAAEQELLLQRANKNDEEMQKVAKQLDNIYDKNQLTNGEQQLLYNMMQLESAAEDYKLENMRLREEIDEYKRREQESKASLPLQIKEVVEKTTKEIEAKIEERQRLDEKREREKKRRDTLLAIARENKRYFKAKTMEQQQKQDIKYDDEGIEDDSEDYDFPEIVQPSIQTKPAQLPQFDRSVKPQTYANNKEPQQRPQTPPPPVYSYSQQKQRDFSPVRGAVSRGLTGLKNLGNTCYMNSIIQCLSNTPELAEYCITDKYKNYISRNNKTKGQIVEEVAALIKVLWHGNYKCVASKDLRYVIGQFQKMFRGVEQQDSHEFLTILMDWLHSDLQTLIVPSLEREAQMNASDKAWQDFTKSKESLILHLFYGQIKSIVKCTVCHKESATYECFSNLSLELPENNNVCHLSQCLDMYFSGERIHGWNCPECKQKRDAIKKLNISKLPPVLVVHLKRFYADPDSMGPSYKKKQNFLRFPLENLNMLQYITISESRRHTAKSYELYAVSNHYGSMESGHYTAFCKSGTFGRWYKFDDQVVTPLDPSNVVSSAAYILFYTRLTPQQ